MGDRTDLAKLKYHRDALATAVRKFWQDCGRMPNKDCTCFFCMELQHALAGGVEVIRNLDDAIEDKRWGEQDAAAKWN